MSLLKYLGLTRQVAYAPPSAFTLTVDKNGYIGEKFPADGYTHYCFRKNSADYSQAGLGQVSLLKWTTIGDKEYVTGIMPDGKEWMCQNLDYVSAKDGIVVGTNCWYYNNNQATYGWNGKKYGLLYTWDAAMAINIDGWHLPSKEEFDTFVSALGSNPGIKVKSTTDWTSENGTDNYGFNAKPSGYYIGSFDFLGSRTYFWTSAEYDSSNACDLYLDTGASMYSYYGSKTRGHSVRLVKDS